MSSSGDERAGKPLYDDDDECTLVVFHRYKCTHVKRVDSVDMCDDLECEFRRTGNMEALDEEVDEIDEDCPSCIERTIKVRQTFRDPTSKSAWQDYRAEKWSRAIALLMPGEFSRTGESSNAGRSTQAESSSTKRELSSSSSSSAREARSSDTASARRGESSTDSSSARPGMKRRRLLKDYHVLYSSEKISADE